MQQSANVGHKQQRSGGLTGPAPGHGEVQLVAQQHSVMATIFGLDHPPVSDEHVPIGRVRIALLVFAVAMFALSFTPVPISPLDFIGGR